MLQASRVVRIVRCNGCGRLGDEVTYMIAGPHVNMWRPLRRAGGSTVDGATTADGASTASGRGALPILSSASVEGRGHECRLGDRLRRLPRGDGGDTGRS